MTKIFYIVHSTTTDNDQGIVSGQRDCSLSSTGENQARELAEKLRGQKLDFGTIFCSTLTRASQTASVVFEKEIIHYDKRLAEIDYGNLTHNPVPAIMEKRHTYIAHPYPAGESYEDVERRIRNFLEEHKDKDTITIISHQAPQIALEVICKNLNWKNALENDWRLKKQWQPFWSYEY